MTTATRTTADVLREMRELLAEPEHWTQTYEARDAHGQPAAATGGHAVCWCLLGGCTRVTEDDLEFETTVDAIADVLGRTGNVGERWDGVADWNDAPERTHAEVLDLLDRAIEAAS